VFVLFKNLPGIEPVEHDSDDLRRCADCGISLVPRQLAGTTIDICPRCHSIWLGAGEFERVAEWYRSHTRTDWPRVSQLEATPGLPDRPREKSGLPKGATASVGTAFGDDRAPIRSDEDPADRMKRAVKLLGDIVDRGMAE
jgi:Zn-finger nucleic acid-binding protein